MDMNVSCTTIYPIGVADERGLPAVTLAKKKVIQIYGTHILHWVDTQKHVREQDFKQNNFTYYTAD